MAKPKVTMPDDLKSKCAAVIHTATTAAAAAGIIPIPMADTIPITAAQITMIIGLGHIFDISLSETQPNPFWVVRWQARPDVLYFLALSKVFPVSEPLWAVSSVLALLLH